MIEQIATNPWIVVGSYVVGVAGIVLACVFYYTQIEKFILSYEICERTLMRVSESRPFDLDFPLVSKGREIEQLTRSYVLITNVGNKLIELNDVVGGLAIKTINEDAKVISAKIVGYDDPGSQVQIAAGDDVGELKFEFLRPEDGFIVKVDHTGSTNEVFVEGRTKIGGAIKRANSGAMGAFAFVLLVFTTGAIGGIAILSLGSGWEKFLGAQSNWERVVILMTASLPVLAGLIVMSGVAPLTAYLFKRFVTKTYRKGPTVRIWQEIVSDNSIYIP
jgi:hypothetical protein